MKLSFAVVVAAMLGTGALAAQAPRTGDKITAAGCLQRAQRNGSVGGTVLGTSASPNTADVEANSGAMVDAFLLSEAVPVVGGVVPETSTATAGTTTSTAAPTGTAGKADITTFGLAGREAELERHQGARIQVTGTVVPPVSSGRGTGDRATATGVKRIQVDSFKILAEKCGGR